MLLIEMMEKLRSNKISLSDAVRTDVIPDSILHYFTCDVAERFFERERKAGNNPSEAFIRSIKVKRRWIEGLADLSSLAGVWRLAVDVAYKTYTASSTPISKAYLAVYKTIYWLSTSSSYWSAYHAASCVAERGADDSGAGPVSSELY